MRILALTLATLPALPAIAAESAMPLPYEAFEFAVPHVDLETCPDGVTDVAAFCRATIANDEIHVFAFSDEGENHLVALRSFPVDGLPAALEN